MALDQAGAYRVEQERVDRGNRGVLSRGARPGSTATNAGSTRARNAVKSISLRVSIMACRTASTVAGGTR